MFRGMDERLPETGGGWAYVSLVSALPGRSMDERSAIAIQFGLFEGAAVVLAAQYDLWHVLPFATVVITISSLGSGLMIVLSERIRALSPPEPYRRLLFDSSIDIVMGLVAFIALITYLIVDAQVPEPGFLDRIVGAPIPVPAVFFTLLVAWDLCYRIGVGWWAGMTALWRTVAFGGRFDEPARAGYVHADLITLAFAGLQLLVVPFVWPNRFLAMALLGHVVAVFAVTGLAIGLMRYR